MENLKLIKKIVNSFHQTSKLDYDDLFQEATIAYFKAMETYNAEKGMITTHLWHCITNHLINYLKVEKEYDEVLEPLESASKLVYSPNFYFEALSRDAIDIVDTLFSDVDKYAPMPPNEVKNDIFRILTSQGKNIKNILSGMKDLTIAYK
jgi:RNA polymerase sigma factor (sigma-70 family)